MTDPVRLLIADDHDLILSGLRSLLQGNDAYRITGECSSAEAVLDSVRNDPPDIVITDLHFRGRSGIELVLELKKANPAQKVLMLTLEDRPDYIREAINAGVNGYILKSDERKKMLLAIEEIHRVGEYFSPAVTRVLSSLPQVTPDLATQQLPASYYRLTPREREVLVLIAMSETNATIMQKLGIEPPTLATHRQNIRKKLGEATDVGMSLFAFKYGLVKMEERA